MKSMFLSLVSESALCTVELQPRHRTESLIPSPTHPLLSSSFQRPSVQLPWHFWYQPNKPRDASPVFSERLKAERGEDCGINRCAPFPFLFPFPFWMFGKSFANLWMNITFHKTFEARRLPLDSCSFGASLCILHIIVDTGVFLNSSSKMPKLTLQSLKWVRVFCCKSCYRCLKCLAGNRVKPKTSRYLVALFFKNWKINLCCSTCFLTR